MSVITSEIGAKPNCLPALGMSAKEAPNGRDLKSQ
jgi:hypothetical protein